MAHKNMAHKKAPAATATRPAAAQSTGDGTAVATPAPHASLYEHAVALLNADNPQGAFELLKSKFNTDQLLKNAFGVCQLRLGNIDQALNLFRGLVLYNGVCLRPDAPPQMKTNYATALLLSGNIAGCGGVLSEMWDKPTPGTERLQAAIQKWKFSLTFWEKLKQLYGGNTVRPVTLDFPPGELI